MPGLLKISARKEVANIRNAVTDYHSLDPWIRVDCESNTIPVHPITAGSAKLPDWLIREAEEFLENNIRGPQERQYETGSHAKG